MNAVVSVLGAGSRAGVFLVVATLIASVATGCGDDESGADAPADGTPDGLVADAETNTPDTGSQDLETLEDAAEVESPDVGCALGTACDDGDPCTVDDQCDADGACAGTAKDCDDEQWCTTDVCQSGGCVHTVQAGTCWWEPADSAGECVDDGASPQSHPCLVCDGTGPDGSPIDGSMVNVADLTICDDGSVCTLGDRCKAGVCEPTAFVTCDDENPAPCTAVVCDPVESCKTINTDDPCDDGNQCTLNDTCAGGLCAPGTTPLDCDDNDPCTVDACKQSLGCTHEQSGVCADEDPCTDDVCDQGNCTNVPFDGPCEDGAPCTSGETCTGGVCSGGGPTDCDDGTPCTDDACVTGEGCVHYFVDNPCSDGFSCTNNDSCVAGTCIGEKSFCPACPLPATTHALKVVDLTIAANGNLGSALDIDEDPTTCAPAGNCTGGIDNALAILAPLLNGPLTQSIAQGSVMYVTDLSAATFDGEPFPLAVLDTNQTEASEAAGCDFQTETCAYQATQFSYAADCTPYFGVDNATIIGTKMRGGGIGEVMTIGVALSNSVFIPLTLVNARIEATLVMNQAGTQATKAVGIIGGAAPKAQLIATMASIPEEALPIDKQTVLNLLEDLVQNDIDLDGDGTLDAASIGIRFVTVGAVLEAN